MLEIVDAHRVKNCSAEDEAAARAVAEEYLLNEVPKEQIGRSMMRMFFEADTDSNGVLDPQEFLACMTNLDLGLTPKEISYLLSQVLCTNFSLTVLSLESHGWLNRSCSDSCLPSFMLQTSRRLLG